MDIKVFLAKLKNNFLPSISFSLGKASRKNQKWRGPDENIRANLRQYGLEKFYLDVLVSDASKPSWRKGTYFDAIITDREFNFLQSRKGVSFLKLVHFKYKIYQHMRNAHLC